MIDDADMAGRIGLLAESGKPLRAVYRLSCVSV
jgi:hypothetical protein